MRFEDLRLYLDEMRKPVLYQKQIDAQSAALLIATYGRVPSLPANTQPPAIRPPRPGTGREA